MGFRYTGIRVRDMDRSVDFYARVMGMRVVFRFSVRETGGKIAILKSPRGSQRLELNWYPPRTRFYTRYRAGDELDHLAFVVPDVKAAYRELRRKGATVAVGPNEAEGTEVYVKDPDGIWLELLGA